MSQLAMLWIRQLVCAALLCIASLMLIALTLNGMAAAAPQNAATPHAAGPVHRTVPNTAPPNILLITLDTTRADRMGFLGSKRGLTPNLDELAWQAAVFTHAYAAAPLTSPSHATILTGTYPQFHQVYDFPDLLAQVLRNH